MGPLDWHPGLGKHQNCLPQNTKPSSLTNLPTQIYWSGNGCRRDILGVAGWTHEGCLRLTKHLGRQNPRQEWGCIFGSHQATAHPRATASLQPCQSLTAKNRPGYSTDLSLKKITVTRSDEPVNPDATGNSIREQGLGCFGFHPRF